MEVSRDEVGAVELDIERHIGQIDAGDAANRERPEEGKDPRQRQLHPEATLPKRSQNRNEDEPSRDRDHLGGEHVVATQRGRPTGDKQVVAPDQKAVECYGKEAEHTKFVGKGGFAREDHRDFHERRPARNG